MIEIDQFRRQEPDLLSVAKAIAEYKTHYTVVKVTYRADNQECLAIYDVESEQFVRLRVPKISKFGAKFTDTIEL